MYKAKVPHRPSPAVEADESTSGGPVDSQHGRMRKVSAALSPDVDARDADEGEPHHQPEQAEKARCSSNFEIESILSLPSSSTSSFAIVSAGDDEEGERSGDESSEGTELAPRRASSYNTYPEHDYEEEDSSSMITPSLLTADYNQHPLAATILSASAHNHQPSGPVPLTLASYLASTLSSPKTRSHSSSSLASFPTDLLSEISRQDSLSLGGSGVETDEEMGSEFNSDPGDLTGRPRTADRTALVMPRIVAGADIHSGSEEASPSRNRTVKRAQRKRRVAHSGQKCILIVGGAEVEKSQLVTRIAQFMEGSDGTHTPLSPTSNHQASFESTPSRTSMPDAMPTRASVVLSAAGITIECTDTLASAVERAEKPFQTLRSILRPDTDASSSDILASLMPALLDKVRAVDLVLWYGWHEEQCADSLLPLLAGLTIVVPLAHGPDGRLPLPAYLPYLSTFSARGDLLALSPRQPPDTLSAMRVRGILYTPLRSRTSIAYLRWAEISFGGSKATTLSREATTQGRPPLPSARTSHSDGLQAEDGHRSDAPSLASSMLDSLTLPQSSEGSSQQAACSPMGSGTISRIGLSASRCIDPLYLPSLIRLMGLNLVDAFMAVKTRFMGLFCVTPAAPLDDTPAETFVHDDKAVQSSSGTLSRACSPVSSRSSSPAPKHHFFACCRNRNSASGDDAKTKLMRCKGLFVMSIVVGVALFFS